MQLPHHITPRAATIRYFVANALAVDHDRARVFAGG